VFRSARFYRGALQVEDERAGARSLLLALVDEADWRTPERFLLLRVATRLLPVNSEPPTAAQARQLAIDIAERDPGFNVLRIKIHGLPMPPIRAGCANTPRPRTGGTRRQVPATGRRTRHAVRTRAAIRQLEQLISESGSSALKSTLHQAIAQLQAAPNLASRLRIAGDFGLRWRELILQSPQFSPPNRVRLLQASLALEQEVYAVGNQLLEHTGTTSRLTRLHWLRSLGMSLTAAGFLSERQWQALEQRINALEQAKQISAEDYYATLRYVARVSQWAQRSLEFQFSASIEHWSDLTDRAVHFIPDRLRGSPLLAYTRVLDVLLQDAQQHVGVEQTLFDANVSGGLRGLNPGLRRGVLLNAPRPDEAFRSDGIYLLPSTTPELPPVAGILTQGEGSSLSHVQLLARNLAFRMSWSTMPCSPASGRTSVNASCSR